MIFITQKAKNIFALAGKTAFLFFILLSVNTFSQQTQGSIKGTVTTSDDQAGSSVIISIPLLKKSTTTKDDGSFLFNAVPTGNYEIVVELNGYDPIRKSVTVLTNETAEVSLQLQSSLKQLNEVVVVSAAKKFAEKKSEYVARLPISNLENPQVYTVVPKELFQEQIAVDFRSALNSAPGLSNVG